MFERRVPVCGIAVVAAMLLLAIAGGRACAAEAVRARAVVDREPLVQGTKARIAVEITIDGRYHVQSSRPHDKYLIPTLVRVGDSAGIAFGEARYPVGEEIPGPGGGGKQETISVYKGTVYVVVPMTVAADAAPGARTLTVSLTTQACDNKGSCLVPTTQELPVEVMVAWAGLPAGQVKENEAGVFAAAERETFVTGAPAATGPKTEPATEAATPAATENAGAKVALLPEGEEIRLIKSRGYRPYNPEEYPVGVILLLSLVGGMILNIMPCVLPVIPLKVLSLVQQAHGDRRLAMLHGVAFSGGVIGLFIALAVVLKGAGLFYGQQFQSAGFLIAMVFFVVALALSMLGVWTIQPPRAVYAVEERISRGTSGALENVRQGHGSFAGSFGSGVMATLLATPCSAPYLGPALAWAFGKPAWLTALALGIVGVGMALPYLVFAMFPQLLSRVPRAGRWSELLKQGLGIVMLGVAMYLVTLIPNVTYWPWVMLGGVVVGMVCWAWGQMPSYNMEAGRIWTIRVAAVVVGAGIGVVLYGLAMRGATVYRSPVAETDGWQPFNVALLDDALAHGRPVVVDWTASWCINCHALEAFVLKAAEVQEAFKGSHAVLLKADLSTANAPATELNRALGGESIPVLAIFSPSRPERPVVLRDNYSAAKVIEQLNKAR